MASQPIGDSCSRGSVYDPIFPPTIYDSMDPVASKCEIPRSNVVFEILPHNEMYGGIKSANKIVTLLRRSGCEAYVATPNGKPAEWLVHPAPCVTWREVRERVNPSDVLIFNWMPDLERWTSPGIVIVHARDRFQDFRSSIVTNYWAVTPSTEKYLRRQGVNGEILIVGNWVDISIFKPVQKISRSIAYMARRGFEFIREIVERRTDIAWLRIENESESRVAELLGQAELFLYPTKGLRQARGVTGPSAACESWLTKISWYVAHSAVRMIGRSRTDHAKSTPFDSSSSDTEAFGNPGLEAMACGAVPLSFEFEAPYFFSDNHLTITPTDIESGIDFMLSHSQVVQTMRAAGLRTAADWNEQLVWRQLCYALEKCTKNSVSSGE
jgi:hypothetical protein